jgi:hypothetical protein
MKSKINKTNISLNTNHTAITSFLSPNPKLTDLINFCNYYNHIKQIVDKTNEIIKRVDKANDIVDRTNKVLNPKR